MAGNIQFKRGNQADLPNPLGNGEPGWATDTKRLYVGNGVANENLFVAGAPVTTAFNVYCASSTYGGDTIANGRTGLVREDTLGTGTTTATTASKLVNGNKNFTGSTVVGQTVFNTTYGTFAKITAIDSATVLSLSHDIMASGENYEIASSLSAFAEAWSVIPAPFSANVILQIAPGTYVGPTLIGKSPTGNFSVTINGSGQSGANKTTINSTLEIKQKVVIKNLETTSDVRTRYGADVTWYTCTTTAPSKLYTYAGSGTRFETGTFIIGNNPENVTNVAGTVTKGYTIYVASSTYGGTAGADGLAITNGSATATTANKLVDSAAVFTSAVLHKTVWNSTDDTWAEVTAVDSTIQLSLSVDIMASGETYVISDAISTSLLAMAAVPAIYNCDTTIKMSDGVFTDTLITRGKNASDAYTLTILGSVSLTASGTLTSYTTTTITDTGAWWPNMAGKLVVLTSGNTTLHITILSNTGTVITLAGSLGIISGTWTYKVYDWTTNFTATSLNMQNYCPVTLKYLKFTGSGTGSGRAIYVLDGMTTCVGVRVVSFYYSCYANLGSITLDGCYFEATANNTYNVYVATGKFNFARTRVKGPAKASTGGQLVTLDRGSGGVISNCYLSHANIGLLANQVSGARDSDGGGTTYDNLVLGLKAAMNGTYDNGTFQTYSNNTTNTSVVTGGQIS